MKMGDKNKPLPYGYPRSRWKENCKRVVDYKNDLSRSFSLAGADGKVMEYEKFVGRMGDRENVITIKYDGEINVAVASLGDDPEVAWFNKYPGGAGKMRTDIEPLSDEFVRLLEENDIGDGVFMGELYALSDDGDPLPFGETLSIITRPRGRERQIHYAVFDVLELNGKTIDDDYWKRCLVIQDVFGDGERVHPVFARRGDASVADEMWRNKVLDEGYEGFVVRTNGAIKVKPSFTFDLAVVGFVVAPAKTYRDTSGNRVKTLVLAWMDEDGLYRYACNCGNGLNMREQGEMADELNPEIVDKDVRLGKYTIHMVRPELVVKVSCGEALPPRDATAWEWDGSGYVDVGIRKSVALRFPRFVRGPDKIRRDKSATNWLDCRIHQVPDWGEPTSDGPVDVPDAVVDESGTASPEVGDGAVDESEFIDKTDLVSVERADEEEGGVWRLRPLY